MKLLISIVCVFLLCVPANAALSAASVFEVETGGADTNGGGFVTGSGGTDMSLFANKNAAGCTSCQSATINISTTDGVAAGTTTITSATGNYSSALVGNIVRISGGTGSITAGWYQVLTVPGATSFTVDRSTGLTAGTGVTVNIGGAILSPSIALGQMTVKGMVTFIKSGTYSITSNSTNTSAGALASQISGTYVIGYNTNRVFGNTDTQPVIQNGASTITTQQGGSGEVYVNLTFDGNSQTSAKFTNGNVFIYCTVKNYNTATLLPVAFIGVLATANSATIGVLGVVAYSEFFANTATPIKAAGAFAAAAFKNLSYANTGASTDGIDMTLVIGGIAADNSVVSNGRDGLRTGSSNISLNNVAESNVANGINSNSVGGANIASATYGNGTATAGTFQGTGAITNTTGTFFTNAASGDFSLNALANQGQVLRKAGYAGYVPSVFPRGLTATSEDIGAAQHGFVTVGVPNIQ